MYSLPPDSTVPLATAPELTVWFPLAEHKCVDRCAAAEEELHTARRDDRASATATGVHALLAARQHGAIRVAAGDVLIAAAQDDRVEGHAAREDLDAATC